MQLAANFIARVIYIEIEHAEDYTRNYLVVLLYAHWNILLQDINSLTLLVYIFYHRCVFFPVLP